VITNVGRGARDGSTGPPRMERWPDDEASAPYLEILATAQPVGSATRPAATRTLTEAVLGCCEGGPLVARERVMTGTAPESAMPSAALTRAVTRRVGQPEGRPCRVLRLRRSVSLPLSANGGEP
jgi:hypothetical protein